MILLRQNVSEIGRNPLSDLEIEMMLALFYYDGSLPSRKLRLKRTRAGFDRMASSSLMTLQVMPSGPGSVNSPLVNVIRSSYGVISVDMSLTSISEMELCMRSSLLD